MPLLVVLLPAADPHPVEHSAGEPGLAGGVRDGDVGDVLPRLVRHSRHELEHAELLQRAGLAVHDVHDREQGLRAEPEYAGVACRAWPAARRRGGRGRVAPSGRTEADRRPVGRSARWRWEVPDPRRPFYPTVDRRAGRRRCAAASKQVSVYVARCASWCSAARTFTVDLHRAELLGERALRADGASGRHVHSAPWGGLSAPSQPAIPRSHVCCLPSWSSPFSGRGSSDTLPTTVASCGPLPSMNSQRFARRRRPAHRRSTRRKVVRPAVVRPAPRPSHTTPCRLSRRPRRHRRRPRRRSSPVPFHRSCRPRHRPPALGRRGQPRLGPRRPATSPPTSGAPPARRPARSTRSSASASARSSATTTSTSTRSAATATCGCSRTRSSTTPARPPVSTRPRSPTTRRWCRTGRASRCSTAARPPRRRRSSRAPASGACSRWFWPLGGEIDRRSAARVLGRDGQDRRPAAARRARLGPGAHLVGHLRRRRRWPALSFQPAPDSGVDPIYGYAVASDAEHTYLFGNTFEQNLARQGGYYACPCSATPMYLARVPRGALDAAPEYRTGDGWIGRRRRPPCRSSSATTPRTRCSPASSTGSGSRRRRSTATGATSWRSTSPPTRGARGRP